MRGCIHEIVQHSVASGDMAKAPAELDELSLMNNASALTPAALTAAKKKKRRGPKAMDGLLDDMAPSLAATAQVQADLLATASDLYRRIEADPHGLRDDEAYWKSLPAHLRTFIRNALPLGQFASGGTTAATDPAAPADVMPRHASTQAMIAVAQQLAQAAHASQVPASDLYRHKQKFMQHASPHGPQVPHVPGMTLPVGDDGDLVFVDGFDDEETELEPSYASDEAVDEKHSVSSEHEKKKKSKKKKKKAPAQAVSSPPAVPAGAPTAAPAQVQAQLQAQAQTQAPTPTPVSVPSMDRRLASTTPLAPVGATTPTMGPKRSMPTVPVAAPHAPLPSSRAAGKLPMMFHTATRTGAAAPPPPAPAPTSAPPPPHSAMQRRTKSSLNVNGEHAPMFPMHMAGAAPPPSGSALTIGSAEERDKIHEFWLSLSRQERRALVEADEQNVLRRLKEYQRHACTCAICVRKRMTIDAKICELYGLYYDAVETHATRKTGPVDRTFAAAAAAVAAAAGDGGPELQSPGPFPGSVALDSHGGVIGANLILARYSLRTRRRKLGTYPETPNSERRLIPDIGAETDDMYYDELDDEEYEDDVLEDEYEDDFDDEIERHDRRLHPGGQCFSPDCYCINSTLTVKGILSVADDLSSNEVQKLVLMMEQLIERSAALESPEDAVDDDSVHSELELSPDEQREQGWRMFQIFAARTLEQRVLKAYRECVAHERQLELLRELEEEESNEKAREAKRAKENQRKKDRKKQMRQQKEEERLRKEQEKAAEEAAAREADRKRQEELQRKREAERKEAEKKEAARKEAARKEAARKEAERKEAERKEAERKEAERKEMERREAAKREERRRQAERKAEERRLADEHKADERRRRNQERRQRLKKSESDLRSLAQAHAQAPATKQPHSLFSPSPSSTTSPASASTHIPARKSAPFPAQVPASLPGTVDHALFASEPFAPLTFGSVTTERDAWDHQRLPSLGRHAFESLPRAATTHGPSGISHTAQPANMSSHGAPDFAPPPTTSAAPATPASFFDYMPSTTHALSHLSLHPTSTPTRRRGAGVGSGASHDFDLGLNALMPHAREAPSTGASAAASALPSTPSRPVVAPIGPIERPRRSLTTGNDVVAEGGVLGSAALGDDEPIEPRGRRTAANGPPLGTSPFGQPPLTTPGFYGSPWSAPGYHLGLGGLSISSPPTSHASSAAAAATAAAAAAATPGSNMAPASSMASVPPAPTTSHLGPIPSLPSLSTPSASMAHAFEPHGFQPAWGSSWDRARHAFEQQPIDGFSPADTLSDLAGVAHASPFVSGARSRNTMGSGTSTSAKFLPHAAGDSVHAFAGRS